METYIRIPIIEIEEVFDINTKLNMLNNQLNNKIYDNFSFNLYDNNDIDNKYINKNKKNLIKKSVFYMKISNKNNININNKIFEHNIVKCPICYNTILHKNNYIKLKCNHVFCNKCYDSWNETCISKNTNTSCPLCREIR